MFSSERQHLQGVAQPNGRLDALTTLPPKKVLQLESVSKVFGGTVALDKIDFDLISGECHVLFGENGAGKSTLIQILAGVHKPTSGTFIHDGQIVCTHSVQHARSLGISAVFQEFSIAPALTVAENLFLGSEPRRGIWLDANAARSQAKKILEELEFKLDLNRKAGDLSRAEKQMLEIARSFRTAPSVLILDEPTASLTDTEAGSLFLLIERLKRKGVAIVYITHRLHEIQRLGDRVTVLRDGRRVGTLRIEDAPAETLIALMTGKPTSELFPMIAHAPKDVALEVRGLSTSDGRLSDVAFNVRSGEVVGVAGLVGSGKGDLGLACIGVSRLVSGEVRLNGARIERNSPARALSLGLCYVPSDRRADGLFLGQDTRTNITISSLNSKPICSRFMINERKEVALAAEISKQLDIRPRSLSAQVTKLSGGNQQKVMIGRFTGKRASVYIFDEPTVGVDVGARRAIYDQIDQLCRSGAAVLLISSDLAEIMNLTNRAYVMHQGRIVSELENASYTQEALLQRMFGAVEEDVLQDSH
jgi:ribose transport system ATP-binding protein